MFFKIYSGDYSKDGYNNGIENAKEGKPKNKFAFFKAVNPINYIWKFTNAYDSYMKNYDNGYLDGQRVNNDIYNDTNQTKGTNMGLDSINTPSNPNTPPSLNEQLALAESLYRLFLQAQSDINDIGTELRKLHVHGQSVMIQEYINHLEVTCIEPRLQQFKNLYMNIDTYDIPAIKTEINNLNNMMHGVVGGTSQSTKFYNFASTNISSHISSLDTALQNADLLDLCTQKELSQSFKRTLQDTTDAMDAFGRQLRQNIDSHSGMFRQFFTNFYQNNAEPRLDELKNIWMVIQNNDIPEVERIINKIEC